jgi:hypothetical protein
VTQTNPAHAYINNAWLQNEILTDLLRQIAVGVISGEPDMDAVFNGFNIRGEREQKDGTVFCQFYVNSIACTYHDVFQKVGVKHDQSGGDESTDAQTSGKS